MKDLLTDKVILITGGGSGLGRAAAILAAQQGARLALVDLKEEGLRETCDEVKTAVPEAEIVSLTADVSDEAAVKQYVADTVEHFGRIDGFYNNAGIEGIQAPLAEYDSDTFNKVLDINVRGVFYGMKYVLPQMVKAGGGKIVNVASVGGIRGVENQSAYVASKHAVVGLTKTAAIEYGQEGVNVNAIAPGAILTHMVEESFKQIGGDDWHRVMEDFVAGNPKKRVGKPEEVAAAVVFLLGDGAGFINGSTITVDGGQSSEY